MKNDYAHTARIMLICAFLSKGGGTLQAMLEWVNEKLIEQGLDPIKSRTLQYCIEALRSGDFDHSRKHEPAKERGKLFKIQIIGKKHYRWAAGSLKPEFGDLDDSERFTLPFLAGILKRYESIPAVQKILYQLPELFHITKEEMESRSAIFHLGPQLHDVGNHRFEEKVINCVIELLAHLHHARAIEFNYVPVSFYENADEQLKLHQVAPLQIRYYESYFYLVAADLEGKRLMLFRVDQINQMKVDPLLNENDEPVIFDRAELEVKIGIKNRFKDSLGVWPHSSKDVLYEIEVKFLNWAATYMKRLRFHPSQQVVAENKDEQSLVVSFRLRLTPESHPGQDIKERHYELAFLLGRFREYAQVLSFRPV